jgi:hypothetical protein
MKFLAEASEEEQRRLENSLSASLEAGCVSLTFTEEESVAVRAALLLGQCFSNMIRLANVLESDRVAFEAAREKMRPRGPNPAPFRGPVVRIK